jgi:hypothetical protein
MGAKSDSQKASADQVVSIDQHRIKLTNLDKVMYPETTRPLRMS